ncbi:hypothetical protein ES703_60811 [subsurface metagenome]
MVIVTEIILILLANCRLPESVIPAKLVPTKAGSKNPDLPTGDMRYFFGNF